MPQAIQRIGLTGGIGSGKSTVGRVLTACGAALVDADAIARELTAPGGIALAAIADCFGAQSIAPDDAMDRDYIRQLAFGDPAVKQRLEAIIHPLVGQEAFRQSRTAIAAGSACVVFDIPLLVESGHWRHQLDRVVVVDCRKATQLARVMARNDLAREMVEKVIAAQATRAERLAAADICLYNDDVSLAALERQVRQLAKGFGL